MSNWTIAYRCSCSDDGDCERPSPGADIVRGIGKPGAQGVLFIPGDSWLTRWLANMIVRILRFAEAISGERESHRTGGAE